MAATVSLSDLRKRIRDRCDTRANYFTDGKIDPIINASIAQLHREIVDVSADWYTKDTPETITVVSGTETYALPDDFYMDRGVDVRETGGGDFVNMLPFNWGERNLLQQVGSDRLWTRYRVVGSNLRLMPNPSWNGTIQLWYVTTPVVLENPSDTFDGIAGMDEYVVLNSCVLFAAMEESDARVFATLLEQVKKGIKHAVSGRSKGEPDRIRDVYSERTAQTFVPSYWRP